MERRRHGFTLVELLVVIAISGVLVSCLLPAVHAAREAARRVQCSNNLKQLATAVRTYQTSMTEFPAAGIVDPGNDFNPRSGKMFSWVVLILPQLEQSALHAQFDFNRTVLDQPNNPQEVPLAMLKCPSDGAGNRGWFQDSSLTAGKKFAKGNYAAYVSPFHTDLQRDTPGALVGFRSQRTGHIRDGLSGTLMLAEVRTRNNPQDQRGAWAICWTGSTLLAFDMHHAGGALPFRHHPGSIGVTQWPNAQGPNTDMIYNCADQAGAQLDRMPCATWAPSGGYHYLSAAPRSQHPGGVMVAFMDGRIGFMTNTIDQITMAYLVCINDGQPAQTTDYVR